MRDKPRSSAPQSKFIWRGQGGVVFLSNSVSKPQFVFKSWIFLAQSGSARTSLSVYGCITSLGHILGWQYAKKKGTTTSRSETKRCPIWFVARGGKDRLLTKAELDRASWRRLDPWSPFPGYPIPRLGNIGEHTHVVARQHTMTGGFIATFFRCFFWQTDKTGSINQRPFSEETAEDQLLVCDHTIWTQNCTQHRRSAMQYKLEVL